MDNFKSLLAVCSEQAIMKTLTDTARACRKASPLSPLWDTLLVEVDLLKDHVHTTYGVELCQNATCTAWPEDGSICNGCWEMMENQAMFGHFNN